MRVLSALFAFAGICTAIDPPKVDWVNGYTDGDCESHNHAGVQTADDGFLLVGDGECYGRGISFNRQIVVAKTDKNGELQWMTNIGDVGYNYGKFGLELEDGTFLIAGSLSRDAGSRGKHISYRALMRLSASGELLHTQLFENDRESARLRDGFMGLALTSEDNTIVATGYVHGEAGEDDTPMFLISDGSAFIMKMTYDSTDPTKDLDVIFYNVFNSTADTRDMMAAQGFRIAEDTSSNGGYVLSAMGYTDDYLAQFALVHTDINGKLDWSGLYKPADGTQSHPYDFTLASDGGYIIAGLAIVKGSPEGRIVKVDENGQLAWDTRFKDQTIGYATECYGVAHSPDGGYLTVCGTGPLIDQSSAPWMNLVHRCDSRGNTQWVHLYTDQSSLANTGEYVVADRNGGYAIYLDAGDWGSPETGGNFGIQHLMAENLGKPAALELAME